MNRIPYIAVNDAEAIERAFAATPLWPIACNNWSEQFPYAPQVGVRLFHSGERLHLRFEVREQCTQALVSEDQGAVWTDSCVEFFLSLDERGYYNFECNCIGRLLLAFRKTKPEPTYATPEVMTSIRRTPTLGQEPLQEFKGDNTWCLTLEIPASALFRHEISSWSGLKPRINLYKCGDNLSQPHFLSWQPIESPAPNFHLPAFFREVEMAQPKE